MICVSGYYYGSGGGSHTVSHMIRHTCVLYYFYGVGYCTDPTIAVYCGADGFDSDDSTVNLVSNRLTRFVRFISDGF